MASGSDVLSQLYFHRLGPARCCPEALAESEESLCSSVNQRGFTRRREPVGKCNCERVHRRYCADVLVEEDIDLRSVEIHIGEVRHLCVLALQLEARAGRRRRRHVHLPLICLPPPPLPPPAGATVCVQPLLWTVRLQFPEEVSTVIRADMSAQKCQTHEVCLPYFSKRLIFRQILNLIWDYV